MIKINMDKAKGITHEKRRTARAIEFTPHDEVISKQIPGKSLEQAEAARQAIRDKYDVIHANVDAATTPEQLKAIIEGFPSA